MNSVRFSFFISKLGKMTVYFPQYSQVVLVVKNLPARARDERDVALIKKIPWKRTWQLSPVFFPGEPNGQRSLVSYRP